jgi:hypothetical protein
VAEHRLGLGLGQRLEECSGSEYIESRSEGIWDCHWLPRSRESDQPTTAVKSDRAAEMEHGHYFVSLDPLLIPKASSRQRCCCK